MQFSALENSPGEKFDPSAGRARQPVSIDEAFVRRALDHANLNVLRIALYQHTQDPELAAMKVIRHARAGSPFLFSILSPDDDERVRQKAIAYLVGNAGGPMRKPTRAEAGRLMELFTGDGLRPSEHDFGWEELAFEDFPRAADWTDRPAPATLADYSVTIIGAGFSGLIAAIHAPPSGFHGRHDDIGWKSGHSQ